MRPSYIDGDLLLVSYFVRLSGYLFLSTELARDFNRCSILQVTATLSLAAACSSAGVMVLFSRDTDICKIDKSLSCHMFQISIAFAFASWFLLAISSYIMFWLVASI